MKRNFIISSYIFLLVVSGCISTPVKESGKNDIKPYKENPRYWQYKGNPVLLLGGTVDDNLFQLSALREHLDLLQRVGGNYIRNTMSSRDSGNLWPFLMRKDGVYDLDQWNDAYWKAFKSLLDLTDERDIIIQIEVWDRFDFSRNPWKANPFNPDRNINYTADECGMETDYPNHPAGDLQPFFHSIPGMPLYRPELDLVRKYQEKFVGKLLSHSLGYGNVLYCMDNETSTPPEWGKYWMKYIRDSAGGKAVYTTDMFDRFFRPQQCPACLSAIAQPENYKFLDVSQINSRNFDEAHWDTLTWILQQREHHALRPVNCVKVYGGENTSWGSGSNADGVERFLRNVVGGCAAVRHHRPPTGNGLSVRSQACIRSVRLIETRVKFWEMKPRMELLSDREKDEAYLTAREGKNYLILFPAGGTVTLDLGDHPVEFSGQWVSIENGTWGEQFSVKGGSQTEIASPDSGGWFAVLENK
jgi:hypothetical protein